MSEITVVKASVDLVTVWCLRKEKRSLIQLFEVIPHYTDELSRKLKLQ